MTGAGARQRMTHRALVERDGALATVSDGYSSPPAWATHIAAMPCFLYVRSLGSAGREAVDVPRLVVIEEYVLLAPLGVDVLEHDRVSSVVDRLGAVLFSGVLNIRSVIRHHDHLEIMLEAAS